MKTPELSAWHRQRNILALAPMQDVTTWAFWKILARYGGPDVYFTEYFRVLATSRLDRGILRSVVENPTGRPGVAQMIGNDVDALVRTARELQRYPVAGIDLNLGCPAPVVYRKCAGGGLLREPERISTILTALRQEITSVPFSVKTRIGFELPEEFDRLLDLFAAHPIDVLTVHGRTVAERYRSAVHYDRIAQAVRVMACPVIANGNVSSAQQGTAILQETGAAGLMIGRGAIRNPWVFQQFRDLRDGKTPTLPTGRDVLDYVELLLESAGTETDAEIKQVQRVKKVMNYLALGVEPTGEFLHAVRRVQDCQSFRSLCQRFLAHDEPMPLEPFNLDLAATDVLAGCHAPAGSLS